jgi:ubiquinone/menaquinone biosynthesis C-methylase UbiE
MRDDHAATSASATWSASFDGAALAAMKVYDEVMVPRLFEPWAALLLDRLGVAPGDHVLDVACGPGTVARIAARRVGPGGRVTGCDLSAAMLDVARAKPPVADGCQITYVEGPADRLAVEDSGFDVVTCQQGLQFFGDRPAGVAEMRRVLKPGGRLGIAVWAEVDRSRAFSALADAIEAAAGAELAARYRGGPFGFPDPAPLQALLVDAGFEDVRVSRHSLPVSFEKGAEQLVATLAASPLAADIDRLPTEQKELLVESVVRAVGPGPIESEAESNLAFARAGAP